MRAYPEVSRRAYGKTIEYGTATPKEIQQITHKMKGDSRIFASKELRIMSMVQGSFPLESQNEQKNTSRKFWKTTLWHFSTAQ